MLFISFAQTEVSRERLWNHTDKKYAFQIVSVLFNGRLFLGRRTGKSYRIATVALAIVLAVFCLSTASFAQSAAIRLRGRVTDPSRAPIPRASVTVTGVGGFARRTETDEEGQYVFRGLPPGRYAVAVTAPNFSRFQKTGIAIVRGRAVTVNAQLRLATQKQEVVVHGRAPTISLNPQNNASATNIRGAALKALSNDPAELQAELQALAGPAAGPGGGQTYVNGLPSTSLPPKSDILEIHVNRNPFSASHARMGNGRIDIITKPGFQKFHGEAYVLGTGSAFDARSPFLAQNPGYHTLFYNVDAGGPLGKRVSLNLEANHHAMNLLSTVNAFTLNPATFQQEPLVETVPTPRTSTRFSSRMDIEPRQNNVLYLEYHYSPDDNGNQGAGQFALPSLAYNQHHGENGVVMEDTQVFSPTLVNTVRSSVEHDVNRNTPEGPVAPTLNVRGAFDGGGDSQGLYQDAHLKSYVEDVVEVQMGKHNVSFGGRFYDYNQTLNSPSGFNGTFVFPSLSAYQITEQGLAQGMTMAQIQAAGGGASQFSISAGNPLAKINYWTLGLFVDDTWDVRPNFDFYYGLRYESQNHISDHADFAPRLGLSWGIGHGGAPKTVLRAGFGIFYDRVGEGDILQAEQLNGINQQRYVVNQPDFYPNVPPISTLSGATTLPTVYQLAPSLRAPYTIESAVSIEQQVARNFSATLSYVNSHGVHQLLMRNINAPLPGTYNPADPSSGTRPYGNVGNIFQYESVGIFNESQLIANFNVREGAGLNLFGNYALSYANADPLGGFPMNQYNIAQDYGPASFVVRNQFLLGGTLAIPFGLQLSPIMQFESGHPYNVTIGEDLNGDSIFNDRPALAAPGATGPNIVNTPYGSFNTQPLPGQAVIPVNYLTGPSNFSVNLRLSKTFGFGKVGKEAQSGLGKGWLGFFHPSRAESQPYRLTLSLSAYNVFNIVNLGTPVGTLTSPLFGQSNSLAGGFFHPVGGAPCNRCINLESLFSF